MVNSENIKEVILASDNSILSALKRMDKVRKKLLLIMEGNKYVGLLSIGDIQRAIINSVDLHTHVSEIIRSDYLIASPELSEEHIKKLMFSIRAEFMPIVSKEGILIDVQFWKDLFGENESRPLKQFNLPVVVMAGGFGTRLKPLTNVLPKPLIPVGGKTILEEIFERFADHGCNNFYVSINYKADLIKSYVNSLDLPYHLNFFEENKPMGTAGSLTLLKEKIDQTFIVTNCDILIDQDYSEILDYHKSSNNEITLVAVLKHYPIAYGIIETGENGQLIGMKEKPELTFKINSGMYILEPGLLKEIPEDDFFHITELIEKIRLRNGKIGVFPISDGSWNDIGDWPEYKKVLANKGFII